jgi:LemA protein
MVYILGLGAVLLAVIVIWLIAFYNKMVNTRTKVENSWGQINVQLKMRTDLIPNLVETVGAYAAHERETLTGVTEARANFLNAQTPEDTMKSAGEIAGFLGRIMAISEQYPDLKADQNFLQMQSQQVQIRKTLKYGSMDQLVGMSALLTIWRKSISSLAGMQEVEPEVPAEEWISR